MSTVIKAILANTSNALEMRELTLDEPQANEVLVKILGVGLCHTDLSVRDGNLPAPLPMVLGHEGAGVVEKVGPGVTVVQPGDRVVLSFDSCGQCPPCQKGRPAICNKILDLNFGGARREEGNLGLCDHDHGKQEIHGSFFGQSSFGTYALASERSIVKIEDEEAPLELLGPLGCGIQTGAGAVINSLEVEPGSHVAIFGAGSVGLSAVMAAKVCGAATIIAIDTQPNRLELARELGATHTFNPEEEDDILDAIKQSNGGRGLAYTVETTGVPEVLEQCIKLLDHGGACAVVGAPPQGSTASFDINELLTGKRIVGVTEGDAIPQLFIPKLIALHQQGRFPFDKLIKTYDLADIDAAVEDSESGDVLKPVLIPSGEDIAS